MSWNLVKDCWSLEGEEVRVLLQSGDITIGFWVKVEPGERRVWLDLLGVPILVVGWQRIGNKVMVPPGLISPADVERRLLAFCRTVRVLPGDDLRARSTWPEQWADIAKRIDEELRWAEREDEPRRFIPTARDLDDVLISGAWFAKLRPLTALPAIAGPPRGRAKRGGQSPLPLGTAEFLSTETEKNSERMLSNSKAVEQKSSEASVTTRRAVARPAGGLSVARNSREAKQRKPWAFSPEQKVLWWASFDPRPSWRLMAQWDGRVSHTTMRNRYNRAVGRAYDIANENACLSA